MYREYAELLATPARAMPGRVGSAPELLSAVRASAASPKAARPAHVKVRFIVVPLERPRRRRGEESRLPHSRFPCRRRRFWGENTRGGRTCAAFYSRRSGAA